MKTKLFLIALLMLTSGLVRAQTCSGSFPNPITDTCWACLFPINIAGALISLNQSPNHDPPPPTICTCPIALPPFQRLGVGLSLWEAWTILEVVRTPGCFPTLNGAQMTFPGVQGTNNSDPVENGFAYYQVHMFTYPILSLVYGSIIDSICFQSSIAEFDLAYVTEVDPLWADDDVASIFSPEVFLFNNPISQAICIGDTASATATNFGPDALYWCSGSQGSVFPMSASHNNHIGGIDSSLAKAHSFLFKLQRHGMISDTSISAAICQPFPMVPFLRKNQFKQQSLSPIAQPLKGFGFGVPSQIWATGFEFPVKGEDFSYLMWRKRLCCAL